MYAVARRQEEMDAQRKTTLGVFDAYVDLRKIDFGCAVRAHWM